MIKNIIKCYKFSHYSKYYGLFIAIGIGFSALWFLFSLIFPYEGYMICWPNVTWFIVLAVIQFISPFEDAVIRSRLFNSSVYSKTMHTAVIPAAYTIFAICVILIQFSVCSFKMPSEKVPQFFIITAIFFIEVELLSVVKFRSRAMTLIIIAVMVFTFIKAKYIFEIISNADINAFLALIIIISAIIAAGFISYGIASILYRHSEIRSIDKMETMR